MDENQEELYVVCSRVGECDPAPGSVLVNCCKCGVEVQAAPPTQAALFMTDITPICLQCAQTRAVEANQSGEGVKFGGPLL